MASPGDTIFWPPLDGQPEKKWPSGPIKRVDGYIPNTLENGVAYFNAQLEKAIEAEPDRYASAYRPTRWQRIKRAFGLIA